MIGMGKPAVSVSNSSGSDGKRDASEKKLFKLFSNLREVLTDPDLKIKAQDGLTAFVLGVVPSASEKILEVSQNEEQKMALLESTKDFTGYQGELKNNISSPSSMGMGMGQEIPSMKLPPQPTQDTMTPGMSQPSGNEDMDALMQQIQGEGGPMPNQQPEMPNAEA